LKNPIRGWLTRRVLSSAFTFEADMFRAYQGVLRKLEGSSLGWKLKELQGEEKMHWDLLNRIAGGQISEQELEQIMEQARFHRIEEIAPLPPQELAVHGGKLAVIEKVEEESFIFNSKLQRMSKIPAVKRAFQFMAEQEREHLRILRRLRGVGEPPA
jgi:rubrerythrin